MEAACGMFRGCRSGVATGWVAWLRPCWGAVRLRCALTSCGRLCAHPRNARRYPDRRRRCLFRCRERFLVAWPWCRWGLRGERPRPSGTEYLFWSQGHHPGGSRCWAFRCTHCRIGWCWRCRTRCPVLRELPNWPQRTTRAKVETLRPRRRPVLVRFSQRRHRPGCDGSMYPSTPISMPSSI